MEGMSLGDDETEAGRRALWMLRNEGVDIRVKQVCIMYSLSVHSHCVPWYTYM